MNISEIAKMAHVSTATVSRVINQSGYVKQETREKIIKIIEETGFQPNLVAKGLRTKQTHLIACLIPALDSSHVMDMIREMIPLFENMDYHVIISSYLRDHQETDIYACAKELYNKGVEGIVLLPSTTNAIVEEKLSHLRIPVICINSSWRRLCAVNQNHFQAGYLLANYALKRGYQKIGYYYTNIPMIQEIGSGIQKALHEANVVTCSEWILEDSFGRNHYEMSSDLGKQLISLKEKPEVFLAPEDRMAVIMQGICIRHQVDIHFAGMGYTELARTIPKELTTIDYRNDLLANKVFEMMKERLINPSLTPEICTIPCRLIEGKSL